MPRYRLILAYDGGGFCGWQKQEPLEQAAPGEAAGDSGEAEARGAVAPAYSAITPLMESDRPGRVALRTVQGVVERAVREVVREPVELIGASRTDSGVHARGQVAAFSCEPREEGGAESSERRGVGWPIERGTDRLLSAINSRLPDDVLVVGAEAVGHGFDPIGDARSKGYSYTFHVGRQRPLWTRGTVVHVRRASRLDVGAMQAAGAMLVGEHDFAAFAAAGHGRETTVRRVMSLDVVEMPCRDGAEQVVRFDISGNGFLWNMVRIIAGTLLEAGVGRKTPDEVRAALESRDRARSGPTAPPGGLCLEWVKYADGAHLAGVRP